MAIAAGASAAAFPVGCCISLDRSGGSAAVGETENWWALAAVPQTWSRSSGCGRWSKQPFAAGAERLAESL